MLSEQPLDYYSNDTLISFNTEFIGVYYVPHNENKKPHQILPLQPINRAKIQNYAIKDSMTTDEIKQRWYDNNKQLEKLKYPVDDYVVMWFDKRPLDNFTIAEVKDLVKMSKFNDQSLFTIWYEDDCSYKQDEAALTYGDFIKNNPDKYEISIKICSPKQKDHFYFYLPCNLQTTSIQILKTLIQEHFKKVYSKDITNLKYRMRIKQQSISVSFTEANKIFNINVQKFNKDKGYIDITDFQSKDKSRSVLISLTLAMGHIMQLKFDMDLNLSFPTKHENDPFIRIQCLQRQSNQSNSIIKKLSIQKRFSQIQQLKVETLLSEYSIEDAHFTSLYWDKFILKPEQKFLNLINLQNFSKLQEIVLISIPENLLYYREVLELQKTANGKNMQEIFEIISEKKKQVLSKYKRYQDKPVKEVIRLHISDIRAQRLLKITEQQYKNEAFLDPLILYTSQYIYQDLNKYLRQNSISRVFNTKSDPKSWQYSFCEKLLQSLMILHNYQGKVYRGSINFDFNMKVGQIVEWNGFNSTSKERKQSNNFLGNDAANLRYLFQIETYSGKQIDNFSFFQTQSEVLILPYTRFQVLEVTKNFKQNIQYKTKQKKQIVKKTKLVTFVRLLQIPIPKKIPGHIVVWIDSNIKENFMTFQTIVIGNKLTNYDLIQLRDNDHFKVWLKEYRQILSLTQANVHFISNMNRPPFFKQQGIETLQIVRSFKPNALLVYYIGDHKKATDVLKSRGKDKDPYLYVTASIDNLNNIFLQRFNKEK